MPRMDNSNNIANTASLGLVQEAHSETRGCLPIPQRRRAGTKNLDWATHRDVLKQLYMHEEKTLKDVMRIMESKHGFVARSVSRLSLRASSSLSIHLRV